MKKITVCWCFSVCLALVLGVWLTYPVAAGTIIVTNGNDVGAGSLRQAIVDAEDGDTISFSGDTTITLGSTLVISKNLTIDGGEHAVVVSGNDAVRVFMVSDGAHVTFDHLTIARGKVTEDNEGGAGLMVETGSVITLTNSALLSNTVTGEDGYGGGLYNQGAIVTVRDSLISGNSVPNWGAGGGIYSSKAWCDGELCDAVMMVQDSTITGNSAPCGGGGIANRCTMTVRNSTISDNVAPGDSCEGTGGGIYNNGGTLTVTHSIISGNTYVEYGGGGLGNYDGTLTVLHSRIYSNTAGSNGGGVDNWHRAVLTVQDCVIYSNTSGHYGGGIYSGDNPDTTLPAALMLINSALFGNTADNGGGIANTHLLTVTNSTLYNNAAIGTGSEGNGGGLYSKNSTPTLVNSILWDNTAATAGLQVYNDSGSTLTISYCDIEGSGGSGAGWDAALGTDGGGNLDDVPLFVDAPSGDLRLQDTSPVIDKGDNAAVPAWVTTDLVGNSRIYNAVVDMGAYEWVPNFAPAFSSTPVMTATQDALYTYAVAADDPNPDDILELTAPTLPTWLMFTDHGDGTGLLSGTPAVAAVGDHAVSLLVTDFGGLTATQTFTITVLEKPFYYLYLPMYLN